MSNTWRNLITTDDAKLVFELDNENKSQRVSFVYKNFNTEDCEITFYIYDGEDPVETVSCDILGDSSGKGKFYTKNIYKNISMYCYTNLSYIEIKDVFFF